MVEGSRGVTIIRREVPLPPQFTEGRSPDSSESTIDVIEFSSVKL